MSDTSTVHLGQFTEDHADEIAERLDDAGIVWWEKRSGFITRLLFAGDWGVRLFVEEARMAEARTIAGDVTDQASSGGEVDGHSGGP